MRHADAQGMGEQPQPATPSRARSWPLRPRVWTTKSAKRWARTSQASVRIGSGGIGGPCPARPLPAPRPRRATGPARPRGARSTGRGPAPRRPRPSPARRPAGCCLRSAQPVDEEQPGDARCRSVRSPSRSASSGEMSSRRSSVRGSPLSTMRPWPPGTCLAHPLSRPQEGGAPSAGSPARGPGPFAPDDDPAHRRPSGWRPHGGRLGFGSTPGSQEPSTRPPA